MSTTKQRKATEVYMQITWNKITDSRFQRRNRNYTICDPFIEWTKNLPLVVDTANSWPSSLHSIWSNPLSSSRVITLAVSFRSWSSWIFTVLSPHDAAFSIFSEIAIPDKESLWFLTYKFSNERQLICYKILQLLIIALLVSIRWLIIHYNLNNDLS